MHQSAPTSGELGFLPAMYSFSGPTSLPAFDLGPPCTTGHLHAASLSNNWETRCLRKHRRRVYDEGCSAKRRRLMVEAEVDLSDSSHTITRHDYSCPPPSAQQTSPAHPQPCPTQQQSLTLPQPSSALSRPGTESSCMEIEAAHRRLQEIEDRITLEDDEDEDLDVEPAPRRPVLVISDSLKDGLQRHQRHLTPHCCPVCEPFLHGVGVVAAARRSFLSEGKRSLQKQRKQQAVSRQPPTPCSSPTPHSPSSPPSGTQSSLYSFPLAQSSGEEDMEM